MYSNTMYATGQVFGSETVDKSFFCVLAEWPMEKKRLCCAGMVELASASGDIHGV